jgi:hypothetical protein
MAKVTPSDGDEQDEPARPNRIGFSRSLLDMIVTIASGDHRYYPDALPTQSLSRIRSHVAAILIEIRGARLRKPSHLRLIVDNTREVSHG